MGAFKNRAPVMVDLMLSVCHIQGIGVPDQPARAPIPPFSDSYDVLHIEQIMRQYDQGAGGKKSQQCRNIGSALVVHDGLLFRKIRPVFA